MHKKLLKILLIVTLIPSPLLGATISGDSNINVSINPPDPAPKQAFTVSLSSASINLNNSRITWYVDTIVNQSSVAGTNFQYSNKEEGQETTIDILVEDVITRRSYQKTIRLNPLAFDLLWEAQTYTPPFYKGKALPSPDSVVKFVAINSGPNEPSNFKYDWSKNDKSIPSGSGISKNSIILPVGRFGENNNIGVSVTDLSNTKKSGFRNVIISVVNPLVIFYRSYPLSGIDFRNIVSNFNLSDNSEEVRVVASPYFFSTEDIKNNTVTFSWRTSGQGLSDSPSSFIIKRDNLNRESISVSITNNNRVLQSAENATTIDNSGLTTPF